MVLSIVVHKGWKVYHLDVKSTFLNGYLDEEMFVAQPQVLKRKVKSIMFTGWRRACMALSKPHGLSAYR